MPRVAPAALVAETDPEATAAVAPPIARGAGGRHGALGRDAERALVGSRAARYVPPRRCQKKRMIALAELEQASGRGTDACCASHGRSPTSPATPSFGPSTSMRPRRSRERPSSRRTGGQLDLGISSGRPTGGSEPASDPHDEFATDRSQAGADVVAGFRRNATHGPSSRRCTASDRWGSVPSCRGTARVLAILHEAASPGGVDRLARDAAQGPSPTSAAADARRAPARSLARRDSRSDDVCGQDTRPPRIAWRPGRHGRRRRIPAPAGCGRYAAACPLRHGRHRRAGPSRRLSPSSDSASTDAGRGIATRIATNWSP